MCRYLKYTRSVVVGFGGEGGGSRNGGGGGGGGYRRRGGKRPARRQWDISSHRQRCRWVYYNIIHIRAGWAE